MRLGRSTFEDLHGVGFWGYVERHPEEGAVFDAAMTSGASERAMALRRAVDLSMSGMVVDVGGGQGQLVSALLDAEPGLRGVVACDFFEHIPSDGDLYVLSRICTTGRTATPPGSS